MEPEKSTIHILRYKKASQKYYYNSIKTIDGSDVTEYIECYSQQKDNDSWNFSSNELFISQDKTIVDG